MSLMDNNTIKTLLENFMLGNPLAAVRIMILAKPIRKYLISVLAEEDIAWLVEDLNNNPGGLVNFIASPTGQQLTREVMVVYKAYNNPQLPNNKAPEPPDALSSALQP